MNPSKFPPPPPREGASSRVEKPGIPPGKHRVKIVSVGRWDKNTPKGEPVGRGVGSLIVRFEDAQGREISRFYDVADDSPGTRFTAELLRAIGWPWEIDDGDLFALERVMVGRALQLVVVEDTWQGVTKVKAKWTNRLPETVDRPDPNPGREPDEDASDIDSSSIPF